MSSKMPENKNDLFIHYNSLISLKLLSDHYHLHSKYIIRMENLEQTLLLKLCESPLLEYSDLKESFFYIRDIDEYLSIYGKKKIDDSLNNQYINQTDDLKEEAILKFNDNFFLQHMMSKKFISIEKLQGNDNYSLKLVVEAENAVKFAFKMINETRSSLESLTFNNIVYLSVYNKEKGQFYFINQSSFDKINIEKNEEESNNIYNDLKLSGKKKKGKPKSDYSDLCLSNSANDKFSIINQSWYINKREYLYSGQLINIIFSDINNNDKKKKMMLSAKGIKLEKKIEEIIGIKEEIREDIDGMLRDNNQKYMEFHGTTDRIEEKLNSFSSINIKGIEYTDNLFEHVVNNSFWVIEKESRKYGDIYEREPIKLGDEVRIKNPLLGLYLRIKKKDKEQKNNSDIMENKNILSGKNNNIINTTINNNTEEDEYELELVNREVLEEYYHRYNFKFFHYNANEKNKKNMIADRKYVLKSVFREINDNSDKNINKLKNFDFKEADSYFEPISISIKNEDSLNIKIEDDYILDIKKIDINEGNQVIYIQNIISELDYILKSYKKKKTSSNSVIKKITQYINFFMEYLLNIEYTFKDDNYEINYPIFARQLLLDKFNVLETILEIINYFLPTIKDMKVRDSSFIKKKSKNANIYSSNRVNENERIKESLINYQSNDLWEKDTAISNMKSMLKLILRFLIHLSENNEDIKQKVFIFLFPILEFSEYIYIKDKSVLLDFIFNILKDSESLQECILTGKLKQSKNNNQLLSIEKILSYIETSFNYLYYYKKLIHLNKIRYKAEEIKEKIKLHIKKVQKEFNFKRKLKHGIIKNNKERANNYKDIIYTAIKTIEISAKNQIKDLAKYLQEKQEEKNQNDIKIKRGKTNLLQKDMKYNLNKKSTKKVNFDANIIKDDNISVNSNIIKNPKKIDLNEKNEFTNKYNNEETNYEAESNDYLNNRSLSPIKSKKSGILNKSPLKKSILNISSRNDTFINKEYTLNTMDKNKNSQNDLSELYSEKYDDFEAIAEKKISDLKLILSFIKYFKSIKFNKILFKKDEFFKDIFGKDIKEEFLENNLSLLINGSSNTINFINGVEFNSNSLLGGLLPFRLYNMFFPTLDYKTETFETTNIIRTKDDEIAISEEEFSESEDDENILDNNQLNQKQIYKNNSNLEKSIQIEEDEIEENEDINSSNKNYNNNLKSFRFDDSSESENENKNDIKESPFKKRISKILNLSIRKNSNKEKNNDSGLLSNKSKNKEVKEEVKKNLRTTLKHKTVSIVSKAVLFGSKKLLSDEPKKSEYQKIYEKCKDYDQEINKNLYIVYSIYFFCINEFIEIVYKTYTIIFNYCINYDYFLNISKVNLALDHIKQSLLPRVIFNNNDLFKVIYDKVKLNPTLLSDIFNIENFNRIDYKNDFFNIEHDNNNNNNDNYLNNNPHRLKSNKTILNRNSGNDFINKDNKFLFNGNEFAKLKVLTKEEIILLDFLIYYCKKNDQINYLFGKIEFFKKLKSLINKISPVEEEIKNEEKINNKQLKKIINLVKIMKKSKKAPQNNEEKQINEEFGILLENLVKKRSDILILYEKLFDIKNQFLYSNKNSLISSNLDDYGIGKQAAFMIKFLEQYEIENYFNKIIYLEIKKANNFNEKNSFEKLMNIQEVFKEIEGEIQKIKEKNEINSYREELPSMIDQSFTPRKILQNKNNENHYKNINIKLQSISEKNLSNIFSIKEVIQKEGAIKLIEMLIRENENFFEKIGFANSLKLMVEFIEKYDDEESRIINNNDSNEDRSILKLKFCKEILRVFIEVKNVFPKFKKLVPEQFDIYKKMIINSLECINNFKKKDNINDGEEEQLFLCICYYSSESLLFLLKYCEKTIKDKNIREFIEKIVNILKNIYEKCTNLKNKIIFQLFYNYLVTRILILLNTFEYDENFIKIIYDKEYMKKRVMECRNDLQKNKQNSNIIEENEEDENDFQGEEEEESEGNKDYLKGKKIPENYDNEEEKNDWKEELYVTRGKNTDTSNEEKNLDQNNFGKNARDINNISYGGEGFDLTFNKNKIIWEDNDEKEKLSFLLLFSSSYIIYLIENKNIDKIISFLNANEMNGNNIDNYYFEEKKNDSSIPDLKNNSFANLRYTNVFRQRQLLEENHSSSNLNNNNLDNNKERKKSIINVTLLTKNNKTFNEISSSENKLNFEVILFESISGSSNSIKKKNYEIPIKKIKYENDSNESNNHSNKDEELKDDEIIKKNYTRLITFYYYEPKILDIILLEKIFKDIEIQKNLKYYCTNSFTNEEYKSLENSKLLKQLLDLQNRFDSITYQTKEYGLLKEQFKKNDMEKFIKQLLKNFNEDDLLSIDKMQDYIYNIMNEIYPHESLYNEDQIEMILSLIESLKKREYEVQTELLQPENEDSKKEKININKSIKELQQIDLNKFFNSLIYLYPKYNKKICLIFYRIAFQLLHFKCSSFFKIDKNNSNDNQMILFYVLNGIIFLFKRENNHQLLESENIFFIMVNSINLLLKKIQENQIFIFKNSKLIQEFFHKLDFVLKHLSEDFDKIYDFMKSPESQQITDKYNKMGNSLNDLITFITTLIGFKKIDKNILTKEINDFSKDIVEKIIKLIFILLKKNKVTSFQSIDLLLNFIYKFIEGPDIDNLNTLFNSGYFVLVSNIVQRIDYYNLFLSNINKENLHIIIDNIIEIECRIVKIFFIYYNICHHEYNENTYRNLRNWYEENIQSIKNKLKRIYYFSKKEMENREYNIDKMLLSLKENDSYTEDELKERRAANFEYNIENIEYSNDDKKIFDDGNENIQEQTENKNNENLNKNVIEKNKDIKDNEKNKNNIDNHKNNDYCLIKFDLILIYYILYSYHQDSINVEYLSVPPKNNLLRIIISFLIECFIFIKNIIISPYYLINYIYKHTTTNQISNIELLQELSDIDKKCLSVDENEMFRFLTNRIKCVEVKLNYIIYKLYFPLLNKAKFIQDNNETYLKVDNNQLSSYVTIILGSYDKINLLATQDYMINKLTEFPIIRILFKYNNLYSILLILIGFTINLLIMLSYSTYNSECNDEKFTKYNSNKNDIRLKCPHLLYKKKGKEEQIIKIFDYLGSILLILQCILFLSYILRRFSQSWLLFKNDYKLKQRKGSNFSYFCYFLPDIFIIFVDFQTIYYLLSIFFIILGIKLHPFFFGFTLLELVNRVELMQTVLKAMYIPLNNILINLLMFIMSEYVFALFALVNYRTHFPISDDSNNFLRTFMRMLDQTFKQDGGIGTYLNQKLDSDYVPYIAKAYAGERFFFDLLFFLSVNTLIFQMFLSTIIDYFNSTKEKKEEFQKLYDSKCLICEQDREDLEKLYSNLKNAFELHINHFHSIIDYIAYLLYLQASNLRDPIIDEKVWKLHLSNNFKYLPKKTCFKEKEKNIENIRKK